MKNLKRIRALAPLFPRYRSLKMCTKRDWNEKRSSLESSRVFRWTFYAVPRTARATYSGFSARSYLISTTSIGCSSDQRRHRTLHFIHDFIIHKEKRLTQANNAIAIIFSSSLLAYQHVWLITMCVLCLPFSNFFLSVSSLSCWNRTTRSFFSSFACLRYTSNAQASIRYQFFSRLFQNHQPNKCREDIRWPSIELIV